MQVSEPRAIEWTRSDYYKMVEAAIFRGRRVELIEGEIIEMGPQDPLHASVLALVDYALKRVFGEGYLVRVQLPLSLGLDSDPEPDVAVVRGGARDYLRSHPDHALLVVEVAESSLEYDRRRKAGVYAEAGIQDYWIVDLAGRRIEVRRKPRRDESGSFAYGDTRSLSAGESVSPLALPGVSLAVAEILP